MPVRIRVTPAGKRLEVYVEEGTRTDTEWTIRRRDGTWVQR